MLFRDYLILFDACMALWCVLIIWISRVRPFNGFKLVDGPWADCLGLHRLGSKKTIKIHRSKMVRTSASWKNLHETPWICMHESTSSCFVSLCLTLSYWVSHLHKWTAGMNLKTLNAFDPACQFIEFIFVRTCTVCLTLSATVFRSSKAGEFWAESEPK